MAEMHPGSDIQLSEGVATSGFRCAISNTKRYMKKNKWAVDDVAKAAYEGDISLLETLLKSGDEMNLFNGDLNAHVEAEKGATKSSYNALQLAAISGQTECIELLLTAKADPHVRECVPHGKDPEDGNTALDFAKTHGWDDCQELLEKAEKKESYGWYIPTGENNNAKCYGCWEHGKKPAKGWYMGRPGAAKKQGLDPAKYGGEMADPEEADEDVVAAALAAAPTEKPLPIGLLFPGQGSQYVKMMSGIKDMPEVKALLNKAKDILGYDLLDLCLNGPESELEETSKCQPAMFVAGMAGVEKLKSQREEAVRRCQVVAGLSLGEYTALCVAGVFSFEDGLKLVKLRGEAMQEAAKSPAQAMLSVAGLDKPKLEQLCADALKAEAKGVCQISNDLFPKGFSVGGTDACINKLKELADKAGALQAKILKTGGGFHTPLMKPAQDKLAKALDDMLPNMKPPRTTVYMNVTAAPIKPGANPKEIVELLKKQLTNPVQWNQSVQGMIKEGVSEFYEVGPMKQLKAMMKRIDPKIWNNTSSIEV